MVTLGHVPGNKYKSLQLSLIDSITDYSVAENNPSNFPDWDEDWEDRNWFDVLVIKNLTQDAELTIKFHTSSDDGIILRSIDIPAIFDKIIFRDVFITNSGAITANFDLMYFSPNTIVGAPRRPTGVSLEEVSRDVAISFKDNTLDESEFIIERSATSNVAGFAVIDTVSYSNYNQRKGDVRIYTDDTVETGTQYWYRLCSSKDSLESVYSGVETITTS